MKLIKMLAIAAAIITTAGLASAQTFIYIVGSNGDRQATQTAIANLLTPNGNWTFSGSGGNANRTGATTTGLSNAQGSNYGAWNGTFNSTNVVIKTSFIGASGAVAALAAADQVNNPVAKVRFPISTGTGTVIDIYGTSPAPVQGTDYELHTADFGLSTNFQATTPYNGTFNGWVYNTLTAQQVGISPLLFIASPGFPAGQNLTTQLAQLLWNAGALPLSYFTGNWTGGDQNKIVYAIGRNTDAGQRYGTYAEFGLGAQAIVKQYQPAITGQSVTGGVTSGGTANTHQLWPQETVSGVTSPLGSGGYVTGSNLAPTLTTRLAQAAYRSTYFDEDLAANVDLYPNATAGYYIGYVTPGDALPRVLDKNAAGVDQGKIAAGDEGVQLSWNGVSYDFANANVKSGKYTAWLYNRLLKRNPDGLAATALALYNGLATEISTNTATQGGGLIDDATVKVKKTVDGGLVTGK
ncbi:MAG: hypothetical protein NTV93_12145 [Verrucomicrobia bacterium]|nr:hypothetical protein [Verrucomicrobiota bacterium]